jgi:hypothetical protein
MTFNYEFISNLTLIIPSSTTYYIHMRNIPSLAVLSVKIMDSGGTLVVQSAMESRDYFENTAQSDADFLYEYPIINGSSVSSITGDIASLSFNSPSFLRVQNTSSGSQRVRLSLRGNR